MKCGITKNDESCLQVLMHRRNYTYASAPVSLYLWRKGFMAKQKEEIWIGSQLNMRRNVYHVTDNEIKQRLELALRLEKPPSVEEVLEEVSTRGVLRGPVDWVFPAWIIYVEYATQRIVETFQLSEEERCQLLDFRDAMKRLLREAWTQTKEKLTTPYKSVAEGTYKLESNKLYAPDGTWIYVRENLAPHITIRGVSASVRFPDLLKLPHERLELLQLGWRASDDGNDRGWPVMNTTQPSIRLNCGEIWRALHTRRLGQPNARGCKRIGASQGK
jgi:hypothetical protein